MTSIDPGCRCAKLACESCGKVRQCRRRNQFEFRQYIVNKRDGSVKKVRRTAPYVDGLVLLCNDCHDAWKYTPDKWEFIHDRKKRVNDSEA